MIQTNGIHIVDLPSSAAEREKMLNDVPPPYDANRTRDNGAATENGDNNVNNLVVVNTSPDLVQSKGKSKNASALSGIFCNRFRFFILVLGTLCLSSVFSNMIVINFTTNCMDPESEHTHSKDDVINSSIADANLQNPKHNYTQFQKTVVQWTVSIASALATFPLSYMCTHYGARLPFLISGICSAIFTAVIPLAIEMGFGAFIVTRLFQGFAYACNFAVLGVLCTRWASLRENAIFLAILTSFTPLSSFLTNVSSGAMCESSSFGWPYAYYLHAVFGLFLFVGWFIFYTDDPRENPFVTADELTLIHQDKSETHINHESFVPYKEICKSPVVWAVWLNAFVDLTCGLFIILYAPTYINKVLHYGFMETGILGGLIPLAKLPVKVVCGLASDHLNCITERYKMCIFNTLAVCGPGFFYIALCYAPEHLPLVSVILFAITESMTGANCGGFYKCGSLASRQYAEFVIACTQFIKCIVFFAAPSLVTLFVVNEEDASQWHCIFLIMAGLLFAANVIFCIYATEKPCDFTKITRKNAKSYSKSLKGPDDVKKFVLT